jgi:hypothetical protein
MTHARTGLTFKKSRNSPETMPAAGTHPAQHLSIAFPLRMPRGLLLKTGELDAYLTVIAIMARTPRGSWHGHPLFGFQELFAQVSKERLTPAQRNEMTRNAATEINLVLADLGLTRYSVDSIASESSGEGMEGGTMAWRSRPSIDVPEINVMLRERGGVRAQGYAI